MHYLRVTDSQKFMSQKFMFAKIYGLKVMKSWKNFARTGILRNIFSLKKRKATLFWIKSVYKSLKLCK